MSQNVNPNSVDAGLERAPEILRAAGFVDVPSGSVIASSPEWMLKLAGVLVLRNIDKLERTGVKDTVKSLIDIANGGVKSGAFGEGENIEDVVKRILNPQLVNEDADIDTARQVGDVSNPFVRGVHTGGGVQ